MNEIEKFASEVFENRVKVLKTKKTIREKEIEKYVKDIIDIFDISNNCEELPVLIWSIKLIKEYDDEHKISILCCIDENEDETFDLIENLISDNQYCEANSKLIEKINNVQIPTEFYEEIADYFRTRLRQQFKITPASSAQDVWDRTTIRIKVSIETEF